MILSFAANWVTTKKQSAACEHYSTTVVLAVGVIGAVGVLSLLVVGVVVVDVVVVAVVVVAVVYPTFSCCTIVYCHTYVQ